MGIGSRKKKDTEEIDETGNWYNNDSINQKKVICKNDIVVVWGKKKAGWLWDPQVAFY